MQASINHQVQQDSDSCSNEMSKQNVLPAWAVADDGDAFVLKVYGKCHCHCTNQSLCQASPIWYITDQSNVLVHQSHVVGRLWDVICGGGDCIMPQSSSGKTDRQQILMT